MAHPAWKTVVAVPAATLGGMLASQAGLPLAWLTGATLATALVSLTAGALWLPRWLYRSGQTVVGVSVGLTVTGDIAGRLGWHLLMIPVAAMLSIAIGTRLAPLLARWSGLDPATAHFSMMPAGISEMAELAGRHGADVGAVAMLHTLRVMLVVFLVPPAVYAFSPGEVAAVARAAGHWDGPLALALAAGVAGGLLAMRVGLPSSFMLGPMIAVAILSGTGLVAAEEPRLLIAAAQVVLGLNLGARLRRETLGRLPRALAVGVPALLVHLAAMVVAALAMAAAAGTDAMTTVLCLATGGAAEMVLTARAVAADAALVAAYQLSRGLSGNALAETLYRRRLSRQAGGGAE